MKLVVEALRAALLSQTPADLRSPVGAGNKWDPWAELINFQPNKGPLISARFERLQNLKDYEFQLITNGSGKALNIDEYAVRIDSLPNTWSEDQFFRHVRVNLNSFLDQSVAVFSAYQDGDQTDWETETNAKLGTLMEFEIQTPPVFDTAAVVVSQTGPLTWTFSTIEDDTFLAGEDWGTHPVAGNRKFGLRRVPGGHEFFTKGADRVYPAHVALFEDSAFKGADDLWRSMQLNLVAYVNGNGGQASVMSPNVPGDNSAKAKPQWVDVCQSPGITIGC